MVNRDGQPAGFQPGAWISPPPGRLIGKGHPAGDFLEAWNWDVLEQDLGYLKVEAELPARVMNPRGQLFGGFTPTYVDLVSLFTTRATPQRSGGASSQDRTKGPFHWMATTNMRVDYFEPIVGPRFVMESRLEKKRGRTLFVSTRFLQDDVLAVFALTTMREVALDRTIGDA